METLKAPQTDNINELIKKRWSPRAFSSDPVGKEELMTLFDAGRRAASSFNLQPWRFVYATQEDPEAFQNLLDVLLEVNQAWAKNAPALFMTIAEAYNPATGDRNAHAWHDVGLAMGNLTFQASHMGLYLHQMGGYDQEKAQQNLNLPDGFEPVAAVAVGYPGDPSQLREKMKESELNASPRKPVDALVFEGHLV